MRIEHLPFIVYQPGLIGSDGKFIPLSDFLTTVSGLIDKADMEVTLGLTREQIDAGLDVIKQLTTAVTFIRPTEDNEEVEAGNDVQ